VFIAKDRFWPISDLANDFLAAINTDSDLWNEISRRLEERFNSEFRIPE